MINDHADLIIFLNKHFALLTLIGFVIVIGWTIKLAMLQAGLLEKYRWVFKKMSEYTLPLGFFVSLFATLTSLYYSYYLHIPACDLCWLQRVFIYPLVFIFGLAWLRREDIVVTKLYGHIMTLSAVGFLIALYHHYLQMGYSLLAPCSTAPFAVDCSTPTFIEYGFVTYPFMAVVVLSVTFLLALQAKIVSK